MNNDQDKVFIAVTHGGSIRYATITGADKQRQFINLDIALLAEAFHPEQAKLYSVILLRIYPGAVVTILEPKRFHMQVPERLRRFSDMMD